MYEKLLSMLYALKLGASDTHYWVKRDSFWGDHKFADYIRNGEDDDDHILDDYIDAINEVCFLGAKKPTPYSKDIIEAAIKYIPVKVSEEKLMFHNLGKLIYDILSLIENIIPEASTGEANLLGNIAQDLQQRYGLIQKRVSYSV